MKCEWMGLEQLIQLIGANPLFIIISYALLGAGLKYIDAAFDEGTLSKKGALLILLFSGRWLRQRRYF